MLWLAVSSSILFFLLPLSYRISAEKLALQPSGEAGTAASGLPSVLVPPRPLGRLPAAPLALPLSVALALISLQVYKLCGCVSALSSGGPKPALGLCRPEPGLSCQLLFWAPTSSLAGVPRPASLPPRGCCQEEKLLSAVSGGRLAALEQGWAPSHRLTPCT